MSPESQPPQEETVVEKLSSLEDLKDILAAILEGKTAQVLQVKKNERGVYFYEVAVALEKGETATYLFQDDVIYVAFRGYDGKEYYGENVAHYVNGAWVRVG